MTKHLGLVLLAALVFASGVLAQESDLAEIASALGLPKNASKADILKAIGPKASKQSATEMVDKRVAATEGGKYEVRQPTLGASEAKGAWYGRAEALFLFREDLGNDNTLVFTYGINSISQNVGADDVNGGIEPGMRLTLGHQLNKAVSLELSYFGLQNWDELTYREDPNENMQVYFPLVAIADLEGFQDVEGVRVRQESALHSAEFNVRHQVSKMGTFVPTISAGLRYLHISENFQIDSYDELPFATGDFATAKMDVSNNMIGLQVGAEVVHPFNSWASLGIKAKAGILANFIDAESSIVDGDEGFSIKSEDSLVGVSGLAEAGIFMTFQPHKHLDVTFGYNATFIAGVATALDQFSATNENARHQGSVLYHGPSVGLTVKF
jgi:hypothetical protein